MSDNSEIDTLNSICREAKAAGKLSGSNLTELYELFGSRFTKALDALKENRVKKYDFQAKRKNRLDSCRQRARLPDHAGS